MKVFVSGNIKHAFDNFEGARVRKSIKGALEMNEIPYTTSTLDYFDVAHLVAPENEKKILEIQENGAPVVVSALYAEDDPSCSFLDISKGKRNSQIVLSSKAIKFLSKADLILVPTESNIKLLQDNGISTPIKAIKPGVNMSRFDFSREDEKEIFYRYYREDKDRKLVIAIGEYDSNMEGISSFINAAKKTPNAAFYFIGRVTKTTMMSLKIRKIFTTAPGNVHFIDVPPDDVYRSALLNADVLMVPGYKPVGVTMIGEAMAARTQIIARKSAIYEGLLEDGVTAHLAEFSETLSSLTRDFIQGKIRPTTQKAYEVVSEHSLTKYGKELEEQYQVAIKDNTHRRN